MRNFIRRKWFICKRGFANIRRSPGDRVYGLIYELSESDERILDGYEGVPHNYVKEYHTITFLDSPEKLEIKALIYISEELFRGGYTEDRVHLQDEYGDKGLYWCGSFGRIYEQVSSSIHSGEL